MKHPLKFRSSKPAVMERRRHVRRACRLLVLLYLLEGFSDLRNSSSSRLSTRWRALGLAGRTLLYFNKDLTSWVANVSGK